MEIVTVTPMMLCCTFFQVVGLSRAMSRNLLGNNHELGQIKNSKPGHQNTNLPAVPVAAAAAATIHYITYLHELVDPTETTKNTRKLSVILI